MKISDIVRHKGATVYTVEPTAGVRDLLAALAEHHIGAAVVVDSGTSGGTDSAATGTGPAGPVRGIVSERDVVRRLAERGAELLEVQVAEIMTTQVVTCRSDDPVDTIAATMTERRIRHMPVVDDGQLVGIVSIGDVVSSRIRQLEHDRGHLEQYITG